MIRVIFIYAALWMVFFAGLVSWRKWSPKSPTQFWKMGKILGMAALAAMATSLLLAAIVAIF